MKDCRKFLIFLIAILSLSQAFAQTQFNEKNLDIKNGIPSLMFDDEQNNAIYQAIEEMKLDPSLRSSDQTNNPAPTKDSEKSYIYLSSIIYLSPQSWAVWINDLKISSDTNSKSEEIYLENVQKDRVNILWQPSLTKWKVLVGFVDGDVSPRVNSENKVEIRFSLKPNQTFVLTSDKVVEGRVSVSNQKSQNFTKDLSEETFSK